MNKLTSNFLTKVHQENNGLTEVVAGPESLPDDIAYLRDALLHTPINCNIVLSYELFEI